MISVSGKKWIEQKVDRNLSDLEKKKKALSLAGNPNIAFDQLEIFQRKKKGIVISKIYPITKIK